MDYLYKKAFWEKAFARAIRTVAQGAAGAIGSAVFVGEVNWLAVISTAFLSGLTSVLMAIATGIPEVQEDE